MKKKCIVFVVCLVAVIFNSCIVAKSLPKELEISQPALSGAPELKSALRISTEMMNVYKTLFLVNKGLISTIAIKKFTQKERIEWQNWRDRWFEITKDLRNFVEKNAKGLMRELMRLEQINNKLFNTLIINYAIHISGKVGIDRDAVANFLETQLEESGREAEKIEWILRKKFVFGASKKEARDLLVMFGKLLSEAIDLTLARTIELTPKNIQRKVVEELRIKTREKRRER